LILDNFRALKKLDGGYLRLRPFPKPDQHLDAFSSLGSIDLEAPYRLSLQAAIWNKNIFLQLIESGETAWDMELKGSNRSRCVSKGFYCTWKTAIHYRGAITLGKWSPIGLKISKDEGMQIDFFKRPKLTSEEIGKINSRKIVSALVNMFPWRFRRTMKNLLRECLKTSQNGVGRANLRDDQIQTSLPDRPE
jgi:hypothetical protein